MANLLVIGTQWGDEGKGKIVDLMTPAFNGRKIVLHLIPSGILHPGKLCVIGNGLVISPQAFFQEVSDLELGGITADRTRIAITPNAHLIMPYHPLLERISEEKKGEKKIGTTCRGIGPAYEDKAARCGIRAGDLLNLEILEEKIRTNVEDKNQLLSTGNLGPLDAGRVFEEFAGYASQLGPYITDVSVLLDREMKRGKSVLFEGAQGVLLDIDHGTYPFVTSSSSTAGGAATGLGVSPKKIDGILGITKAYTTRVGAGPFPTELTDERGKKLARRGDEFGATTGRPRRCGWFDAVAVAYSCRLNGIDRIALTKPDVLEDLEEVSICVGYTYKGTRLKSFPTEHWILEKVVPEYLTVPGWRNSVHRAADAHGLPQSFKDYIRRIEDLTETRVALISTGVERRDTILLESELRGFVDVDKVRSGLRG